MSSNNNKNKNNTPSPRRSPRIANQSLHTGRLLSFASNESSPTMLPTQATDPLIIQAIDRARHSISQGTHGFSVAAPVLAARESVLRNAANANGRRRAAASAPDDSSHANSKRRGNKFHNPEIFNFLHITEDILPISGEEWEEVETEHMIEYAENNRTGASLRRNFMELYNKKVPTGDPNMPDTVRLAKKIRFKIEEKSDAAINVDVDDAELGIEPADDTAADTAGVASARARRSEPRPFVSPRNRSKNNATGDLVAVMMASMMERQQRAEEEREDRRVQQQQSQMMMAAMMASFMGRAAPAQTRHAGVGDDEADDSWEIVGGGVGKPKDDHDYP